MERYEDKKGTTPGTDKNKQNQKPNQGGMYNDDQQRRSTEQRFGAERENQGTKPGQGQGQGQGQRRDR